MRDTDKVKLEKVRVYILNNLNKKISLRGLSKEVGTNVLKLKYGFKFLFGVTVFQFITEQRLQKAKKLLLESDVPIYSIASIVGYTSTEYFATAFKRKFGYSPSTFRKWKSRFSETAT